MGSFKAGSLGEASYGIFLGGPHLRCKSYSGLRSRVCSSKIDRLSSPEDDYLIALNYFYEILQALLDNYSNLVASFFLYGPTQISLYRQLMCSVS
jgi:hypothetical protein